MIKHATDDRGILQSIVVTPSDPEVLVYDIGGALVKVGDKVHTDFGDERDAEEYTVTGWRAPMPAGIFVNDSDGHACEYFPSVFDCSFKRQP